MEEKTKIPVYKKWWFWVILIIILCAIGAGATSENSSVPSSSSTNNYQKNNAVEVTVVDFSSMNRDEVEAWFTTNKVNGRTSDEYSSSIAKGQFISQSISANTKIHEGDRITVVYSLGKEPTIEEKNALAKAESYSTIMHMSKAKIYEQLISEYGEGFTKSAAQYAMENLVADWNANALAKAKSYQSTMNMSKKRIYEQLISEYGEQFTKEQAQYAIDHLDE